MELNPVSTHPAVTKKKVIIDFPKPVVLQSETNEDKLDTKVAFFDDRYPAILAKFKIDSRIAANRHQMLKRATESISNINVQSNSAKPALSKIKSESNMQLEEQLKDILDDMGLIDDYANRDEKREIAENAIEDVEDENMECGTNKINLLKENSKDSKDKRYSKINRINRMVMSTNSGKTMTDNLIESPLKDKDYSEKSELRTKDIREKREKVEGNTDISGSDEKVSLNNIRSENEELNSYEKRVEREIREKIEKLKQDVKQEIENLSKIGKSKMTDDSNRRKRQVTSTLLDEERKDIDPLVNVKDNSNVHIRKKRHLKFEISPTHKINLNVPTYTPIRVRKKRYAPKNQMYIKNSEDLNDRTIDNIFGKKRTIIILQIFIVDYVFDLKFFSCSSKQIVSYLVPSVEMVFLTFNSYRLISSSAIPELSRK